MFANKLDLPKTPPNPGAANAWRESVFSERDEPVGSSNEEKQILGGSGKSGAVGILGKPSKEILLGLDVGERRIGVSMGDSVARIASPLTTLEVDGTELDKLQHLIIEHEVNRLVVGLPRNMSGQTTQQTEVALAFGKHKLRELELPIHFQDESLTSVAAERELNKRKKPYSKGDVDALAATYILQDFMEGYYGR
jgi:putative holliday junction resolvase